MARRILNGTSLSDRIIASGLAAGDFAVSRLGEGNDLFEGSAGNDQAWGDAGNDVLYGRAGHDSLVGGEGNDSLDGGDGNDTLDGGAGNDSLEAGAGDDVISGGAGANRIRAGAGNDRVTAGDDGDMIWGDAGNDTIHAGGGNNWIYAGEGNDSVTAGDIGDMIWGDAGDDTINAGGGNNWVYGGSGNDSITAGDIGDWLYGDAGDDTIIAGGGNNWVYGGEGRDSIRCGMDNDMLHGEAGDDVITDAGGQNFAYGGAGHDRITLGAGHDFAYGDDGNDTISLGHGNNAGYGGIGNDSITAGDGQDQLHGEDGDDTLNAGAGQDQVLGGAGNDLVLQGRQDGTQGQDYLRGGAGTDTLRFLFTTAEWFNSANQAELARLVAANATSAAQSGAVIGSTLFGLNFAEFEALSVAVNGTVLTAADDPVTARADTFNVLEGASVSGSVVANDTVPDLIASVALRGAAPTPGAFSLSNAGLMSFNTGTSFEYLAAGQVATLSFNYRVTDGDGDTGDARVTLRITGTNDAASISGTSTGAVAEDGTLTAGGTLTVADVDTGEARFATPASLAGTYGSFTFNATSGLWGYTLSNAAANVQALNAGQTVQDTLTVTSLDTTASRVITVSIAGRNDAASISGSSTGAVAEDGTLTAGGTLSVADVDAGQARFATPASLAGTYGSFTFNATSGLWGYTLSNTAANVQALAQGQTVQDTLTVTSFDTTASRTITVSIAGANDAPVNLTDSNAAANLVLEGAANGSATGVTMGATDPEGDALSYSFKVGGAASAVDATGRFAIDAATGVITVADGAALNFEAGATQSLTVFARDALGAETSTNVVITLTDRDETPATAAILSFDDVPGGALGDGGERPLTSYAGFTFSQAGIYNPDGSLGYATSSGTTLAFFAEARNNEVPGYPGVAGSPLVVARGDGTDFDFYSADFSSAFGATLPVTARAYDDGALVGEVTITVPRGAAPNFDFGTQYPGQRFTSIDRLEFSASDYFGLDDFAFGNVTAIIGGAATGAVAEDGTLTAGGTLSIVDPDPGQASFAAPAPSALAGTYGSFTFNAGTGAWGYTLNNAAANVQALLAGQSVTDTLNVASLDGSASQAITVTIAGARETPIAFDDTLSLNEDTLLDNLCPCPRGFTLRNDTIDPGGDYIALVVDGPQHGTLAFRLNGSFSYMPTANFSGTDSFTYRISHEGLLSNIATVTLTVNAVNDAPLAGADSYSTAYETALTVPLVTGLLANDSDVEGSALAALLDTGPAHGTLALNADGSFVYTPHAGYSGADGFTYRASDGDLTSALTTVTLTVGAAPLPGLSTGTVAEDGMLTAGGTLSAADLGSGFATPASLAGSYGSFGFNTATGQWSYALDNGAAHVQALNAGQSVTDVLNVTSSAGTRPITVTVNGANDPAAIGGTSTGNVAEDGTLTASGRLTVADADAGQARFAAPPSLAGVYGNFTFDAMTGDWGYALNNAAANVQALAGGQTVTDVLNVASLDGTANRAITVSIAGANEVSGSGTLVARNESYTLSISFPAGGAPPESGTTSARLYTSVVGDPMAYNGQVPLLGTSILNNISFPGFQPDPRYHYSSAGENIVSNDSGFGPGVEVRLVEPPRPGGIFELNPLTGVFTYQNGFDWSLYRPENVPGYDAIANSYRGVIYSDYFIYKLYNTNNGEYSNTATVHIDLFEALNNNDCIDPIASQALGGFCLDLGFF